MEVLAAVIALFTFLGLDFRGVENTFAKAFRAPSYHVPVSHPAPVPEPCSLAILAVGGLGLVRGMKRRSKC